MKNCPSNKILNPLTNRCVLKSGLIGKKILKTHINKITSSKCNKIKLTWENNSCYLDSLLVALFINNDDFIKTNLLNASINNYGLSELNTIGKKIKEIFFTSSLLNKFTVLGNQIYLKNYKPLMNVLSTFYQMDSINILKAVKFY